MEKKLEVPPIEIPVVNGQIMIELDKKNGQVKFAMNGLKPGEALELLLGACQNILQQTKPDNQKIIVPKPQLVH